MANWYNAMYYGSETVLSIVTLAILFRIAKAMRNLIDVLDIFRQLLPNAGRHDNV